MGLIAISGHDRMAEQPRVPAGSSRRSAPHGQVGRYRATSLPAWALAICILAIGILTTTGIEETNRRQDRASRSELIVTQIRVLSLRVAILSDQFRIDPTQARSLSKQLVEIQSESTGLIAELGQLAPGPEQTALATTLEKIRAATVGAVSLAQANGGQTNAGQTYIKTVLQPLGLEFQQNLNAAQSVYHDEAKRQLRHARLSTISMLTIAVIMIGFLIVLNERQRRANLTIIARQERRFRSLVQHATDLISMLDEMGNVRFQSPSIHPLLGRSPEAIQGLRFVCLVHPDDRATYRHLQSKAKSIEGMAVWGEVRLIHADESVRTVEIVMSNLTRDPDIRGYLLTSHDVTVRNELTSQIAHSAMHDPLTGLPNRRLLMDRLAQGLARAQRSASSIAAIFIDLDDFKEVNDTYGHDAGDELLRKAAQRIKRSVRPEDTVARLGGDEFVVLLEGIQLDDSWRAAERIANAMKRPLSLEASDVRVLISVGVALSEGPLDEPDDLLQRADLAMYSSKRTGDGRPVVYDEQLPSGRRPLIEHAGRNSADGLPV